ncbi:MAG TPA: hypothetical protein PK759_02105 [Spirochaetales bacterium]|nr:hypothetical protein [Spirochaetales bacterium]
MKKKVALGALVLALIFIPLAANAMSITASLESGTVQYTNPWWGTNPTWINGTVTVTCTAAEATLNPWFTVDLAPRADIVNGSCARNANWRYYNTSGGNSSIYIDDCEIYTDQSHSTNSDPVKMWDVSGVGDVHITGNNVFTGQFTSGGGLSKQFQFSAVFWNESTLGAGTYEMPITFRLRKEKFSSSGPSTAPVSTITVVLRYYVGTTAAIFFTDGLNTDPYTGTELFSLDFDEITAAAPKQFTIHIQTNFKFYLGVYSGNGGYLLHERYNDPVSPVKEKIPYTLNVDGVNIPLSSGYRFPQKEGKTGFGLNSNDYNAILTIGDITSYTAGTYSDILSFRVTSY